MPEITTILNPGNDVNMLDFRAWLAEGGRFTQTALTNNELRTGQAKLEDLPVSVFDNMTAARITAIREGTATTGIAEAINEVLDDMGDVGGTVWLPRGLYDLRVPLVLPSSVSLIGESVSFPANVSVNQGFTYTNGTVLGKKHSGDCITVTAGSNYSASGSIENIAISSDKATYASGRGIVLDKVGSYRLREVRIFSTGGDALVLGTSAGDVTGQIHIVGLYINNPGGKCITNRSRWLKAMQIETDGGTHSFFTTDTTNCDISQFHFEGAEQKAVVFGGANKHSRLSGGYIALTNVSATKGIEFEAAAGNTDITIDHVEVVGHSAAEAGIDIGSNAWRTTLHKVTVEGGCLIGIRDAARDTVITNSSVLNCVCAIESSGNYPRYHGNRFDGTTGDWAIKLTAIGVGGVWTDNVTDKPFRPNPFALTFTGALAAATSGTLTSGWTGITAPYTITFSDGSTRTATLTNASTSVSWTGAVTATASATGQSQVGYFGGHIVKDNIGYKTSARGKSAVATGVAFAHTMSVQPWTVSMQAPAGPPATLAWTVTSTNLVPTFGGGGTVTFDWSAHAYCENPI